MRTFAAAWDEGMMNVVSDKLNCRASACMVPSSNSAPCSKTQRGLPVSVPRCCVNTLTMRKRWEAIPGLYVRPTGSAARCRFGPGGGTLRVSADHQDGGGCDHRDARTVPAAMVTVRRHHATGHRH